MDEFELELLSAAYGGVRIDITRASTSEGNDLVLHQPPRRNIADVDHQGNKPRIARCQVVFMHLEDEDDSAIERFKKFRELAHDGSPHYFVHPIEGSYLAHVDEFSSDVSGDDRDWITVECSFLETREQQDVFAVTAGVPLTSAVSAVRAQSDATLAELEALGLPTDLADLAVDTVDDWEARASDGLSTREVSLELATVSQEMQELAEELDLASDLSSYPAYREVTRLHFALLQAADTFVVPTTRLIDVTLRAATPLRVLAARIYGADQSDRRYQEMLEINDIAHPGAVPAGTVLKAVSPSATKTRSAG